MLLEYIRRQRRTGLFLASCAAIFAAVVALYGYPAAAVGYAAMLCAALGLAVFAAGYAGFARRHRELRRLLDGVTHKMLSNQLKELAADGLVERIDYGEVPPRVDYRLTPNGEALMPIFDDIQAYIRKNACSDCCGDKPAAPYGARHGCCE